MYSPKIYPDQVEQLYKIKCVLRVLGGNETMVDMVNEALAEYLPKKTREVNKKAIKAGIRVASAIPMEEKERR